MRKSKKTRDQLLRELRNAYEGGASIRNLAATTGRSYGSISQHAARVRHHDARPRRPQSPFPAALIRRL